MKFPIIIQESPNYDDRPFKTEIDTIIIHYTGMPTTDEALARLSDSSETARDQGRVSAHYLIDEEGKIFAMVDERDRAWHAGQSFFRGRKNLNDMSIGIELSNPGHAYEYKPFPRMQLDALVELCASICKRHPIQRDFVLGHSDIAIGRKIDPGEKFNWRHLARAGIGWWPEAEEVDYPMAQMYLGSSAVLRGALIKYGYNPSATTELMCQAFNRHFGRTDSTTLTWEVAASLAWLNRKILKVPA